MAVRIKSNYESIKILKDEVASSRAGKTGILKVSHKELFNLYVDHGKLYAEIFNVQKRRSGKVFEPSFTEKEFLTTSKTVNGKVGSTGKVQIKRNIIEHMISDFDEMYNMVEKFSGAFIYVAKS